MPHLPCFSVKQKRLHTMTIDYYYHTARTVSLPSSIFIAVSISLSSTEENSGTPELHMKHLNPTTPASTNPKSSS